MNPDAETLLRDARKLPESDHLRLAEELRASVPAALSDEWTEEVVQRVEAGSRTNAQQLISATGAYTASCSFTLEAPLPDASNAR